MAGRITCCLVPGHSARVNMLITALVFLVILIFVSRMCFVLVVVEGMSMCPTLCPGDRALVLKGWPARFLQSGQIVVVRRYSFHPEHMRSPKEEQVLYVKRVLQAPRIKESIFNHFEMGSLASHFLVVSDAKMDVVSTDFVVPGSGLMSVNTDDLFGLLLIKF
ncbi:MAG: S26 family signal peptidase [Anaerolineae bacterium]|nr:MAG: S26 family signal peptidase [Anaerolineae bacterium]